MHVCTHQAYAADVQMLRDADFDSVKQDNCGDDQGLGFVARMQYINRYTLMSLFIIDISYTHTHTISTSTGRALLVEDSDQVQ